MAETDLNKVIHMISNLEIPINVCQIFDPDSSFENVSIIKKESASDTEVIFATYMKMAEDDPKALFDVAIKCWLSYDEMTDDQIEFFEQTKKTTEFHNLVEHIENKLDYINFLKGLTYEANVYNYITETIIKPNLSPNFIPLLAFGKCSLSDIQMSLLEKLGYNNQIVDFVAPSIILPMVNLKLNIMVTGSVRGSVGSMHKLLEDDLSSNILSVNDRAAIIFQCLNALLILDYYKIMHYDLHMGNILVQKLSDPICLTFNIFGNQVSFSTTYIPKFFDWDRGFIESLGENPSLNTPFSISSHSMQRFMSKKDYYQFICSMSDYSQFWDLLKPILPTPNYTEWRYTTKVDAGKVDEKHIPISNESRTKLNSFVGKKENEAYITQTGDGKYIEIDKPSMQNIFSADEIYSMMSMSRFTYSDLFYIRYGKGSAGKKNEVYVNSGWICQALFNPSDKLLYPLDMIFADANLFQNLTLNLNRCDDEINPVYVYSFQSQ